MTDSILYSVVIPTFNSASFIKETVDAIATSMNRSGLRFEIIIVDDASNDDTWSVLEGLKENQSNHPIEFGFKAVRLSKNFGQHKATMCGFARAEGDFVLTMDDDLEANPDAIPDLIQKQKEKDLDLVYAHYSNLKRGVIRTIFYTLFKLWAKMWEGKNRVNGSSFRLIKTSLAKKVIRNANSFAFMDELFLWNTEKIDFVDVKHQVGLRGSSNYSIGSLVRSSTELILFSSDLPLKFLKFLGLSVAGINFLIGSFYLIKKMMGKIGEPGYTSLIVSILFSTGLILFAIGIIGEYLNKVFKSIQNVPLYSVDQEI